MYMVEISTEVNSPFVKEAFFKEVFAYVQDVMPSLSEPPARQNEGTRETSSALAEP